MLVKTNEQTKSGRDIYENALSGKRGPLPIVGHDKGTKVPNGIFGVFKKTIGQQKAESEIRFLSTNSKKRRK